MKIRFRMATLGLSGLVLLIFAAVVPVQASGKVVDFEDITDDCLLVTGFELPERTEIEINAVGGRSQFNSYYPAYGWILDAGNRRVVWSMADDCYDENRLDKVLFECHDVITLSAGKYEAYYFVGRNRNFNFSGDIEVEDLKDLIALLGEGIMGHLDGSQQLDDEDLRELMMAVYTDAPAEIYTPEFHASPDAIVDFRGVGPDEQFSYGIELDDRTQLKIHAIGEFDKSRDFFVDGAWIVNADNREVVWEMDKWNTDPAEGADKNRVFNDYVTLPAGKYIVHFITDDSHDYTSWNAVPPADPMNYGIVVTAYDKKDLARIHKFDSDSKGLKILALVGAEDSQFYKKAFRLHRKARIRIYALGEQGILDNSLADYGWIVNAENLEKVWRMRSDQTRFAGGTGKNRSYDGVIELDPGDYIVYYRTDDSHSASKWNASPPLDYDNYGITLYGLDDDFKTSDFTILDDDIEYGDEIIVNLTGLGDDEDRWQRFALTRPTEIQIIALGEGRKNHMYDYGWIENDDTREMVWEMTYDKTEHGGGADKNRLAIDRIRLPKGNYTAYFITDDSHSSEGFNASPPDDPDHWGMIIRQK